MTAKHILARPPKETPSLYQTDGEGKEAIVYAHYFIPGTRMNIFVTEYDPKEDLIFGWSIFDNFDFGEFGYTSMKELDDLELNLQVNLFGQRFYFPYKCEIDLNWTKRPIKDVLANLE